MLVGDQRVTRLTDCHRLIVPDRARYLMKKVSKPICELLLSVIMAAPGLVTVSGQDAIQAPPDTTDGKSEVVVTFEGLAGPIEDQAEASQAADDRVWMEFLLHLWALESAEGVRYVSVEIIENSAVSGLYDPFENGFVYSEADGPDDNPWTHLRGWYTKSTLKVKFQIRSDSDAQVPDYFAPSLANLPGMPELYVPINPGSPETEGSPNEDSSQNPDEPHNYDALETLDKQKLPQAPLPHLGTGNINDDLFRFFGDTDGDRDVDGQDYGLFRVSFLEY